jgi:RNA polymerase sigma factor (sigma-70 family)
MSAKTVDDKMDDLAALDRVLAGDIACYEVIIRRYNPLVYKIGRSYGLQHEDVQDAMQDTFISAYENLSQFQRKSQLSTWLIRIMINKCLYKMNMQEKNIPLNTSGENASLQQQMPMVEPGKFPLQTELKKILELSLEKLPEQYRLVFLLRETENFSIAQTAEALNITALNVKVRLHRAKAMMRESLEQWYSHSDIYEFNLRYCTAVVENVLSRIG